MTYSIILFCVVHPVFLLISFSNALNFILDGILNKKIHGLCLKCQINAIGHTVLSHVTVYCVVQTIVCDHSNESY